MKSIQVSTALLTILASILLTPEYAFANKEIGRIIRLQGIVKKVNGPARQEEYIQNGDRLYQYDQLLTSDKGFVKILMKDDTIFQLGGNSHFNFNKFNFKTKKNRQASYQLLYGRLRSLFTVKARNNKDIKMETPTVSMGIRGTEFITEVFALSKNALKRGKTQTDIALLSGKLRLKMREVAKNKAVPQNIDLDPGEIFQSQLFFRKMKHQKTMAKSSIIKKIPKMAIIKLKKSSAQGGKLFLKDTKAYKRDEVKDFEIVRKVNGQQAALPPLEAAAPSSEVRPNETPEAKPNDPPRARPNPPPEVKPNGGTPEAGPSDPPARPNLPPETKPNDPPRARPNLPPETKPNDPPARPNLPPEARPNDPPARPNLPPEARPNLPPVARPNLPPEVRPSETTPEDKKKKRISKKIKKMLD